MQVSIVATNGPEVQAALERQGKAGELAARRCFNRILRRVVPLARALAPSMSGKLAASVRISSARYNPRTGVISGAVVAGGAPLNQRRGGGYNIYAIPQESGKEAVGPGGSVVTLHHDQGQSPFVLPPFVQQGENAGDELMAELDSAVQSAG